MSKKIPKKILNSVLAFFSYFTHSIRVKLIAIFSIAAVFLIVNLLFGVGYSVRKQLSESVSPFLGSYFDQLENELGSPINLEIAKKIVRENPINLAIQNEQIQWTSCKVPIHPRGLDVIIDRNSNNRHIIAGFYRGQLFMQATYVDSSRLTMLTKDKLLDLSSSRLITFITAIVIVIVCILYFLMSYYFVKPVKLVQKSLQRIGRGEVSHRLDVNRNDEIGELAKSVNDMSSGIEDMLDSKRQMLLGISHELRSPLTRAKLIVSLKEDCQSKYSLLEEFDKMEMVITDLLESERVKEGHAPLSLNPINVNDLICQVRASFFEFSPVVLHLDNSIDKSNLDGNKIALVIRNIISNALSASRLLSDKVAVSTYNQKDNLVIKIKDTGEGISACEIDNIFKPFYRVEDSKTKKNTGLGIGLHLSKTIIDAHRGKLSIDSELGKGTLVSIYLPKSLVK